REHGSVVRGWLGVRIQAVSEDIAESFGLDGPRGALIASVQPDGPASKAGLQAGDIILSWDDEKVKELKDLPRLVAATEPGEQVKVKVWRNQATQTVTVETGTMPAEQEMSRV